MPKARAGHLEYVGLQRINGPGPPNLPRRVADPGVGPGYVLSWAFVTMTELVDAIALSKPTTLRCAF